MAQIMLRPFPVHENDLPPHLRESNPPPRFPELELPLLDVPEPPFDRPRPAKDEDREKDEPFLRRG